MYRIMMIEDDEKIRRIVADTLKKWQYDVVEVTQFDQVLSEFEEADPHLELSRNEFILLQLMMRNIGKILSREDLMQALWNEDQFIDDNTLTVNVNRMRRKIAGLGLEDFIVTRKGMGYVIE